MKNAGYARAADRYHTKHVTDAMSNAGLRHGFSAATHKHETEFYIIVNDHDVQRAYPTATINVGEVLAKDWDYSAWRTRTRPVTGLSLAVGVFLERHLDLAREDGTPVLTTKQHAVLESLLAGKDVGSALSPEEKAVLEIAIEKRANPRS
jgi:hypothetical protein